MKNRLVFAAAILLGAFHHAPAFAFDLTSNTTTAQTASSGTNTVELGITLNVSSTKSSGNAISVTGTSTIDNNGTVEQSGTARAIRDTADVGLTLTVNNGVGALITATANDVIEIQFGDNNVLFNNYGMLIASGSSDQAVNFNHIASGSNALNNYSSGVIQSTAADAVRPGINGIVNNAGSIKVLTPVGDTSSSDGIDAQSNSGITVSNAAINDDTSSSANDPFTIEGERHGITGGNTDIATDGSFLMSITNAAGFTIQADNGSGINIDGFGVNSSGAYTGTATGDTTTKEVVTINNSGTITGNGVTRDGDGVDVDGLVDLNNTGTIKSLHAYDDTSEGVTVGGGAIVNSGLIEGSNSSTNADGTANTGTGRGITLAGIDHVPNVDPEVPITPVEGIYADTTVINSGTIRGDSDAGIALTGAGNGNTVSITNNAGGLIQGGGTTLAAVSTGATPATVINYGTITEVTSGIFAVDFGSGDDSLQILGGAAAINGNISGGTGASSLKIIPGAGNTFGYVGVISNFASAEIGIGTTILAGANTYTGATTIDTGGTLQLDGSIAGATTANGTLQGGGTASGDVEVTSSGTIHPGDIGGDTATLTIGALSLDPGSVSTFDLGTTPASNDTIQSSGAANIANGAILAITLPATPAVGSYVLINANSIAGNFQTPSFTPALPSSLAASVLYSGTTVTLQLQTVSSLALGSSDISSSFGQSITFSARVSGSLPSGTVTFYDGTAPLGSGDVNGGIATFTTASLAVGLHDITATYSGDADKTPAKTAIALAQQVNPAASITLLASATNPSSYGQSVTLTATVSGQTPTGTVTFNDSATAIAGCSAVAFSSGTASSPTATCATSSLSTGTHALSAVYSGDASNNGSTSAVLSQVVNRISTTTVLSTSCATTFVENQPFTMQSTTSGSDPAGSVTFNNGATALCSGVAVESGTAACTVDNLAVVGPDTQEQYLLTANYSGDANNAPSSAAPLVVTVLSADDVVFRDGFEANSASCPIE